MIKSNIDLTRDGIENYKKIPTKHMYQLLGNDMTLSEMYSSINSLARARIVEIEL